MADFPFSIEFFPPKTPAGKRKLKRVRETLGALGPEFFSVTYGAGGSTRTGTRETVLDIQNDGFAAAPHLSFGSDDAGVIEDLLNEYRTADIRRIVALRGDVPSGLGGPGQMKHADELIRFIRETQGDHFLIEVAAYPEVHPESATVQDDINFFKRKVDAGATGAITQYFFNADAYFRFRDLCDAAGITIDIVPGIMPITNYAGLRRFSDNCGADIPRWIARQAESYGEDEGALRAFGEEVVTGLCRRLLDGGAPGIHFYTLNQANPTARLIENLR